MAVASPSSADSSSRSRLPVAQSAPVPASRVSSPPTVASRPPSSRTANASRVAPSSPTFTPPSLSGLFRPTAASSDGSTASALSRSGTRSASSPCTFTRPTAPSHTLTATSASTTTTNRSGTTTAATSPPAISSPVVRRTRPTRAPSPRSTFCIPSHPASTASSLGTPSIMRKTLDTPLGSPYRRSYVSRDSANTSPSRPALPSSA